MNISPELNERLVLLSHAYPALDIGNYFPEFKHKDSEAEVVKYHRQIMNIPTMLRALKVVRNDYDNTGCDGCGIISQDTLNEVIEAIKSVE